MTKTADVPDLRRFLNSDAVNAPFLTVLGHPISHSLSPLIQNAALDFHQLDMRYYAVDVPNDQTALISDLFSHPNFRGSNITIPHKSEVLRHLDVTSDKVRHTGACNTVYRNAQGRLAGENTDISGFLRPINRYSDRIANSRTLVFGTGGAASAIIYALELAGVKQIIQFSRTPGRNHPPGGKVILAAYGQLGQYMDDALLLVNCTPLGMHPNTEGSPLPDEVVHQLSGKICYDIVYRPRHTHFLNQAKQNGAEIIDGTAMFVGQAADAFRLFTGKSFPDDAVIPLLYDALKSD